MNKICKLLIRSTISRKVHIDDEVTARTAKASVAFGRLRIKSQGAESNQT